MKLIIDIDEELYKNVIEDTRNGYIGSDVWKAVAKGKLYEESNKIIKLFNKYDILLVHIDGKIVPVKNSTKQQCYDLLYEIQELIEWSKLLFIKHLSDIKE